MARLVHPSGDLEIKVSGISCEGEKLVVEGTLGVWNAHIYVPPWEVAGIIRLLFNWPVIAYLMRLPLLLLKSRRQG